MSTYGKRRALGQHFLKDTSVSNAIAEAILQAAEKHGCKGLLEIGPGRGAITEPLLAKYKQHGIDHFLLVEKDRGMAEVWRKSGPLDSGSNSGSDSGPTAVEEGDFLELAQDRWLRSTPLAVVSNLPYSVGTAILTRLARYSEQIPVMVLMLQAEVAQRVRAEPQTKQMGSLSLWIQNRWEVQKILSVPPNAFSPPPEVQSEVILLTRRESPRILLSDEGLWESLLKTCFAHRRKMLRSVLKWQNVLELSGVDGTKRAEALSWPEWDRLFQSAKRAKASLSP